MSFSPLSHLKLFHVEQIGPTVVLTPDGDPSGHRYRDLQAESNSVRTHLSRPENKNLIIDLSKCDYFGSEFIGALVSMLREVRARQGKAAFCAATDPMQQVLQKLSLFRLWPYVATREEAIQTVSSSVAV